MTTNTKTIRYAYNIAWQIVILSYEEYNNYLNLYPEYKEISYCIW